MHVLCNNEDIQHSPFMAEIVTPPSKDFYPDKVSGSTATNGISAANGANEPPRVGRR